MLIIVHLKYFAISIVSSNLLKLYILRFVIIFMAVTAMFCVNECSDLCVYLYGSVKVLIIFVYLFQYCILSNVK